jgi:hypothetical protein
MTNDLSVTFFEGTVTSNELIDTFFGGGQLTTSGIIVIFSRFFNEITK